MEEKRRIRFEALAIRDKLSAVEREVKDRRIWERLVSLRAYREAEVLLVYVNFKSEVGTLLGMEEAWRAGKIICTPRVEGKKMIFYQVESLNQLSPGCMGISEPEPDKCAVFEPDGEERKMLLVMPGCAFDALGSRVGYGGGYYDRFLACYPQIPVAALFFECQRVAHIPAESFDVKPGWIVTENSIYQFI